MAEIRVAPRKKGFGWVWLLLALVVVAAIVYFLYANGTLNFAAAADTRTFVASAADSILLTLHGGSYYGTA